MEGWDADAVDPIVAYRRWNLTPKGRGFKHAVVAEGVAMSQGFRHEHDLVQRDKLWPAQDGKAKPMRAECSRPIKTVEWRPHPKAEVPYQGCSCGLYGFHSLSMARDYRSMEHGTGSVLGAAIFWGRVLFDEHWIRAEWALPLCLVSPYETEPSHSEEWLEKAQGWAEGVSGRYGLPILPFDRAKAYAERYGVRWRV